MIERAGHRLRIEVLLRQFPVVAIVGARQVGKTTLARSLGAVRRGTATCFDLESAEDLALLHDPMLPLRPLRGLVVIDEVQKRMVRQLPSWHENVGKRQVKAPKLYVRDSGLLHALLGLRTHREIQGHPKVGASW